ncbi:MAG: HAMP domain-containing histidine kinase [Thermoflexales bacterium]|nr:HAMP domain-containing histidine kinase [Thermoflexales bacterium]
MLVETVTRNSPPSFAATSFVGMAAHDLRSPVGYIQTATTVLLDPSAGLSEAERKTVIEGINRQTHHMLALIDNLLDMSQLEAGRMDLDLEIISLSAFLRETVECQTMLAAAKGTHVVLETIPPGEVRADSLRLRRVLDNLISNAVKYSPPGSTVRVSAWRTPMNWQVSVQDEGPGIPPDEQAGLFQDYGRLSLRPTAGERSTGLGLAISRRIVEAHGGQIGVESRPEGGAVFWFTLPHRTSGGADRVNVPRPLVGTAMS